MVLSWRTEEEESEEGQTVRDLRCNSDLRVTLKKVQWACRAQVKW